MMRIFTVVLDGLRDKLCRSSVNGSVRETLLDDIYPRSEAARGESDCGRGCGCTV